jgi:beta-glucanase (GH16 family)
MPCQLALAQPSSFPVCLYPVDTNWHTYALTWTSNSISMSMDGQSTDCSFTSAHGYDIPSTPMFMLIQTQTGGSGGDAQRFTVACGVVSNVTVTQP